MARFPLPCLNKRSRTNLGGEGSHAVGGENFDPATPADFGLDHPARAMNAGPPTAKIAFAGR
jgi:hypothetical protein